VDLVDETLDLLRRYLRSGVMAREIDLSEASALAEQPLASVARSDRGAHLWGDGSHTLQPLQKT
jgi:hypothetical protein